MHHGHFTVSPFKKLFRKEVRVQLHHGRNTKLYISLYTYIYIVLLYIIFEKENLQRTCLYCYSQGVLVKVYHTAREKRIVRQLSQGLKAPHLQGVLRVIKEFLHVVLLEGCFPAKHHENQLQFLKAWKKAYRKTDAALKLPTEIGMPKALRPIELDLSLLLSILGSWRELLKTVMKYGMIH